MEVDDESDGEYNSYESTEELSDAELNDYLLPSLNDVPTQFLGDNFIDSQTENELLDAGPSFKLHSATVENQVLCERAYQVIDGKISSNELEGTIKVFQPPSQRGQISPFVSGLIGQANMSFVRGDYDGCLQLCKEAIRADPSIPEPYRTLSEMYEDMGDQEKSLQLGMIAASNSTRDAEAWMILGDKAIVLDKPKTALHCYLAAVRIQPSIYIGFLNIIKLYDPEKDKKYIIFTYQRLVKHAPVELGEKIMEFAQAGAKFCVECNDPKSALALMEVAFQKIPACITLNDINLIVELHVQLRNFRAVLEVITTNLNVCVEGEEDIIAIEGSSETSSQFRVTSCVISEEIPLQIQAKLAIAIIHLKAFHLVDELIAPFADVVEDYGDLLIDIAEAFMSEDRYVPALNILKLLVNSKNFSAAQVWYHYGECLRKLDRKEEAVSAYLKVMEQAPQHAEARLIVSDLLNALGRSDEAITALKQDPTSGYLDIGMLFERCVLLKEDPSRSMEFLAVGRLLLSRHCARFSNRAEFLTFVKYCKLRSRVELQKGSQPDPEEPTYVEGKRMPAACEEYQLFLDLCETAYRTKQYPLLQRLTCSALGSKVLCSNTEREAALYNLAAIAIFLNKDCFGAINFFKNLIIHGYDTPHVWNMFNLMLTQTEDTRWTKYIIRLLTKKPQHFAIPMIYANNCFTSGTYKQALSEYLLEYKRKPSALLSLLIAITCLHISMQKHVTNVNVVITQAMGYLSQYRQMRGDGCEQEVNYNMARLHHQLGIYGAAIFHYKKVLEATALHEKLDLKKEAAYNLSRIYQASKSYHLARYYIQKYIVI